MPILTWALQSHFPPPPPHFHCTHTLSHLGTELLISALCWTHLFFQWLKNPELWRQNRELSFFLAWQRISSILSLSFLFLQGKYARSPWVLAATAQWATAQTDTRCKDGDVNKIRIYPHMAVSDPLLQEGSSKRGAPQDVEATGTGRWYLTMALKASTPLYANPRIFLAMKTST